MNNLKNASRWYVYELVDSRDGSVFYVGKGTGLRMYQHEKDADNGVCSKKTFKINSIRASKHEVLKNQVAFFWDEQAAYDHETDRIELYGLHNLTNVLPGGQKAWTERQRIRAATRLQEAKPLEIDKFVRSTDERIFQMFRNWFALGLNSGGKKVTVTPPDLPNGKYYAAITEAFYNSLIPMLWRHITADKDVFAKFSERMKRHNVELIYGCA